MDDRKGEGKVILELTREQANVIENACELIARLAIGQFETVTEKILPYKDRDFCRKRDDANDALNLAAKIMFGRNQYNMPDCQKKDILHQRAWNIYQVLRYTRCWHDYPEGDHFSVCFDKPMNLTDEPMPTCKIMEENEYEKTQQG